MSSPSAEPPPGLSVVVPVRDGETTLAACLDALLGSQGLPAFEIVVVDDGSRDRSTEIAAERPCRRLRLCPGRGPAAARNAGAAAAGGAVLAFVDADVIVRHDTLSGLLAALQGAPAAFATYAERPAHDGFPTLFYHALSLRSLADTEEHTPAFYTYCAALGASLFRELGGFDERFRGATFEDLDLGLRLARRGLFSRHCRHLEVTHAVRYDARRLARAYFRKSRDLAFLLLSGRRLSASGQGWTDRRNWLSLFGSWGTLGLLVPAIARPWPWAAAWATALLALLVRGLPPALSLARRRAVYGPLALASFLAVNLVATAGMAVAALDRLGQLANRRPPA